MILEVVSAMVGSAGRGQEEGGVESRTIRTANIKNS